MLLYHIIAQVASTTPTATSLTTLGEVFTQIVNWMLTFLRMISTEPLLLIGIAVIVVGAVIGIAFRAIRGKGRRGS